MASNQPFQDNEDSRSPSLSPLRRTPRMKSVAANRPKRSKMLPRKFATGIDKQIPGVPTTFPKPKGVSIQEPTEEQQRKKPPQPETGKGKEKVAETSKATKRKRPEKSQTPSKAQSSAAKSTEQPPEEPSTVPNALFEIYNHTSPPPGFSNEPTYLSNELAAQFKDYYVKKGFCPEVHVNLAKLKEDCNLDLSPWLKPFQNLFSITTTFNPNLVRLFYFNMHHDNLEDCDKELVEERVSTYLKGVKITLSAAIINSILQIENPPPPHSFEYTNRQIHEILKPNEPVPEDQLLSLDFKPASMSPLHRILWYFYSRNLVQKGGNFTHFTKKDYPQFTAIVDKKPINVGHWIFEEMVKAKFGSRKPSYLPYPSLISVIMFYHKIWHLGSGESIRGPIPFGKQQLHLMRLNLETEGSGQSRAPSRSKTSHVRAQEAQSAPPQSSLPTDFDTRIKAIVNDALDEFAKKVETEIGNLITSITTSYTELVGTQDSLKTKIEGISGHLQAQDDKLAQILKILAPTSEQAPPQPTASTSHPDSVKIPPSKPSASDPGPSFVDDKGGEKGEEKGRSKSS